MQSDAHCRRCFALDRLNYVHLQSSGLLFYKKNIAELLSRLRTGRICAAPGCYTPVHISRLQLITSPNKYIAFTALARQHCLIVVTSNNLNSTMAAAKGIKAPSLTIFLGNLDPKVDEKLLYELGLQVGASAVQVLSRTAVLVWATEN